MAVVTTPTRHWRILASQLQIAGNITNPAGVFKRRYLSANLTKTNILYLIIECTETVVSGAPQVFGASYDRVNKKVVSFADTDVFQMLIVSGEALPAPANRVMNYVPAGSRGPSQTEDEVVVTDNTTEGRL